MGIPYTRAIDAWRAVNAPDVDLEPAGLVVRHSTAPPRPTH